MSELRPFEIKVMGRELALTLGMCIAVLMRNKQEIDYLKVNITEPDDEESSYLHIYDNVDLVRWMAGYRIDRDKDGDLLRPITTLEGFTFRSEYGWNPVTVEKEQPQEWEEEAWLDIQAEKLDKEWRDGI